MIPILAEADAMSQLVVAALKEFGLPGALVVIVGYTLRRLFKWGTPIAERIANAHIDRQVKMGEQQEKLTNASISIQQENATILKSLDVRLAAVCKARCPTERVVLPQRKKEGEG